MLTARPTQAPGREAHLDRGPAPTPEGSCSPWSGDSVPVTPSTFCPAGNISNVPHTSQPPVYPC